MKGWLVTLITLAAAAPVAAKLTNIEKLLRRKPALVFDSKKSVSVMSHCLATAGFFGAPSIIPDPVAGGALVLLSNGGHTQMLLRIERNDAGSSVSLHRIGAFQRGEKEARGCQ